MGMDLVIPEKNGGDKDIEAVFELVDAGGNAFGQPLTLSVRLPSPPQPEPEESPAYPTTQDDDDDDGYDDEEAIVARLEEEHLAKLEEEQLAKLAEMGFMNTSETPQVL